MGFDTVCSISAILNTETIFATSCLLFCTPIEKGGYAKRKEFVPFLGSKLFCFRVEPSSEWRKTFLPLFSGIVLLLITSFEHVSNQVCINASSCA